MTSKLAHKPVDHRKANKRNEFQKYQDRKLAIELLAQGHTYSYIAAKIRSLRPYTISTTQIFEDCKELQRLAPVTAHGIEAVGKEVETLDAIMGSIATRLQALPADDSSNRSLLMLKMMADCSRRMTYLLGGDAYLQTTILDAALETVRRAGFEVIDPRNVLGTSADAVPNSMPDYQRMRKA